MPFSYYLYKKYDTMKNRLQFNRIPTLFKPDEVMIDGTTTVVPGSGRKHAMDGLSAYTQNKNFIPLIGEPIVARYLDDNKKKQLILAIGKATGATSADTWGVDYHMIDTALLEEEISAASSSAVTALDLASGATKRVEDYLVILKNMILSGVGLSDGSYFDNGDPSGCGYYLTHEGAKYIISATSMSDADYKLDQALAETVALLFDLSAETISLSAETVSLDATVKELSANTMAADKELSDRIEVLEGQEISGRKAIEVENVSGDSVVTLKIYENDKVLSQSDEGLKATVKLNYLPEERKISLVGVDGQEINYISTNDFIKDGMLDSANVFVATEEDHQKYPELVVGETYLVLYFNTDAQSGGTVSPVFISAKDLVDTYEVSATSINYLGIHEYKIWANVENEDTDDSLAKYSTMKRVSALTVNMLEATGLNNGDPGSYIPHTSAHYISGATNLYDADTKLDEAIWGVNEDLAEYSGITEQISADTYHAVSEIDNKVSILSGQTYYYTVLFSGLTIELSANTASLSANTVGEVERLDGRIDELSGSMMTEIERLDGRIDELSAATESLSGNTVAEVGRLDERIDELSGATESLSANTVAEIERLDGRIDDLSDSLDDINGSIDDINDDLDGIHGDIDTINDTISTLGDGVDAVNARIDNMDKAGSSTAGQFVRTIVQEDGTVSETKGYIIDSDLKIVSAAVSSTNVKEEWKIVNGEGTQLGSTIKVYNDSSLNSVTLSGDTATGGQWLIFNYTYADGSTGNTAVDVSKFLVQAEFKSGVTVDNNGVAHGVVDPNSETFLTVGANGFKLSGVQDAINSAVGGMSSSTATTDAGHYVTSITMANGVLSSIGQNDKVNSAWTANSALTCNSAITATSAKTATSALTANSALTCNSALTANSATTATSAKTSVSALTANSAITATSAKTSTSALTANSALTCNSAITATSATTAAKIAGKDLSELLTAASLGTNGNNTTVSVTVGGTTKTGSTVVSYASSAGTADTVDGYHIVVGSTGNTSNTIYIL